MLFRVLLALVSPCLFAFPARAAFLFHPTQPVLYSSVTDEGGRLWGRDFETATTFPLGEVPKLSGLLQGGDRPWYFAQTGNEGYLRTLTLADPLTSRTHTIKLAGPENWLRAIRTGRFLYKSVI